MWVILVVCAVAFFIAWFILAGITVVQGPQMVVTTRWPGNAISRVLKSGIHWMHPLESAHYHTWTYLDQQFKTRYISSYYLPTVGAQLDLAPVECVTADDHTISLDMFLMYFVADGPKAVSRTTDPLILLCQQTVESAREHVAKYTLAQLSRNNADICKAIVEDVARDWTPTYGLALERCQIQAISSDDETIARRRKMRDGWSPKDCAAYENAQAYGTNSKARVIVGK